MTTSVLLLSLLLPASDPVSPDEIQVAVAALEEYFSGLRSLEVKYHVRFEWARGFTPSDGDNPAPSTHHWIWNNGKEYFSIAPISAPDDLESEWWFDGEKTYIWKYAIDHLGQVQKAYIQSGPPVPVAAHSNHLARAIGFRILEFDGGILSCVKAAMSRGDLRGSTSNGRVHLALGLHDYNNKDTEFEIDLDPREDYRLVSIRMTDPDSALQWPGPTREWVLEESQLIRDEGMGKMVRFPRRAIESTRFQILRLNVESVRINHPIPEDRFADREPPFGTEVRETSIPGKPARRYLVGGKAAEQQRLEAIAEQATEERERLDREGVTFSATPQRDGSSLYWMFAAGALFLASWFAWNWSRNR